MAIPKVISYKVPQILSSQIRIGIRVEVPLKNRMYSGLIISTEVDLDPLIKPRDIISVIDQEPIISLQQVKFWTWISDYYCCSIGEVMNVALPAGLKLSSETKLILNPKFDEDYLHLKDKEYLIAEAIHIRNELTINQVQEILDQKTVYPVIRNLIDAGVLYIKEELKFKYRPKKKDFIQFALDTKAKDFSADQVLELTKRSEKQTRALLILMQSALVEDWIEKSILYEKANIDASVLKALLKKGLINTKSMEVSRLNNDATNLDYEAPPLSDIQVKALQEIELLFEEDKKVLLFGVTGSGKTRVYIELIRKYLDEGKQVLYLLPEIALTTQLVVRLKVVFGESIGVYHSKMNNAERVELWKAAKSGKKLFVGARSSLFLPFSELGLIIVDEEHDPSFKQQDPAPRYQARDASIFLASMYGAKVLMGTATPSLESYDNTINHKYGLVKILERYGNSNLPEIKIVDLKDRTKKGLMKSVFSQDLIDEIKLANANGEQSLLFQNRRGYAPTLQCDRCNWHAECPNCDVSLTIHKFFHELRCHYCGYKTKLVQECPSCGEDKLDKLGFGTEKIENELASILPNLRIARLDYDTAKTQNAFESILDDFGNGEIDVLVGTQMITKGLDFDKIAVVGILQADKMLHYPDFRAHERAFQLLTQVAGRAGRRDRLGKVIIQTYNPTHPVILETVQNNFVKFYTRELAERQKFYYPPFTRLIEITLKHKRVEVVNEAADIFCKKLRLKLSNRVFGPTTPGISRIRGSYIQQVLIKMEKDKKTILYIKELVKSTKREIRKLEKKGSVRIIINVDP